MAALTYWYFFGTIYLTWLMVQDYRNKRKVDDRRNWFMMGISVSLISHIPAQFLYKVVLTFVVIGIMFFMKKIKGLGEADINSLGWIFLGFGYIHYSYLLLYYIVFSVLTAAYLLLKNYVFRYKPPVQFYGVLHLSFIITSVMVGGYVI